MTLPKVLPDLPSIGLQVPDFPAAAKAFQFTREHCDATTYNHTARAAYWALILSKKLPEFRKSSVDLEVVVVGCILHDMGWATSKELLSNDKRFEVDGANIARDFVRKFSTDNDASDTPDLEGWSEARAQRMWDGIALHTTPSIARFAAPEVALTHLGVMADFAGPGFAEPGGEQLITLEEYRAVMEAFPRAGFNSEGLKKIACWLCRTKAETTFDNWVSGFGLRYGTDGTGAGKEVYAKAWEKGQAMNFLLSGLDALDSLDHEKKTNL
ncbi:uncharacterized protein LTHEOB_9448 [Neofusicoccum parvum]|nr:uncharacterized protein LTHEOB_9448 [Neofusicoccum parvum]